MTDSSQTAASGKRIRRYPGVRSFEDQPAERELFFGREEETYELLQLIRGERLLVLFARSGIGKSSIINAGLMQPLREQRMFPIVARVSGETNDPLDSFYRGVKAALETALDRGEIEEFEPGVPKEWNRTSLWHFFKSFYIWRRESDEPLQPVVVFDQFEELFTLLSEEQRRPFIDQLADLVRGIRPGDSVKERRITDTEFGDRPPEVRIVLAIREDFMADLEEMAERIPAILKTRFRLGPLSAQQARVAIREPGRALIENAETDPFEWSEEALDAALDFLRRRKGRDGRTEMGNDVEPFQLQLVCQFAEGLARDRDLTTIAVGDLGGERGLRNILSRFYQDSIDKISAKFRKVGLRRRLRTFCEYGLITESGRRLLREESTIRKENRISSEVLSAMVESRLIRKESRLGDSYFELTHDTLIDPILDSRRQSESRRRRFAIGAAAVAVLAVTWSITAQWRHVSSDRAAERRSRAGELIEYGRQWGLADRPDVAVAFYEVARAYDSVHAQGEPRDTAAERIRVARWLEGIRQDSTARMTMEAATSRAENVFAEQLEVADAIISEGPVLRPDTLAELLEGIEETIRGESDELLRVAGVLAAQLQVARADSVYRLVEEEMKRISESLGRRLLEAGIRTVRLESVLTRIGDTEDVRSAALDVADLLATAAHSEEALFLLDSIEARFPEAMIPAQSWNDVCWFGGLFGDAGRVERACENAVGAASDPATRAQVRDSRGLVRALIGVDSNGAMADFRAYAEAGRAGRLRRPPEQIERRAAWSSDLTLLGSATLDSLRSEDAHVVDRAEENLVSLYVEAPEEEGLIRLMEGWWASNIPVLDHLRERPEPQCPGPHSTPVDSLVFQVCDSLWVDGDVLQRIEDNECSAKLREIVQDVGFVDEVFVTDTLGYNVCVSGRTTDYYQEDEEWWRDARKWELDPTGTGRSHIDRDQSVGSVSYQVYATMRDPDSDELLGVIKVVFDYALCREVACVRRY